MTSRIFTLCILAALLLPAASAQDGKPLPDSPSAVKNQQAPAAAAPAPAPAAAESPAPATPASPPPAAQSAPAPAAPAPAAKPAPAAPAPASKDDQDPGYTVTKIIKRVDEVNVIFTVTDKHGRFVKNLTQNDINVLDDHLPPREVVAFHAETDLPLRVGLLIDSSNSVRDRFKFEQEAAIEFLNQIVRRRTDRAFVVGFDTEFELTADYTDNTESLSRGVRMLRPGGGTALYDAIYRSCREKLTQTGDPYAVRKAIILLSDGEDNQSHVTREEAVEMAQRAEVIIYAISTNISNLKSKGDQVLQRLAEATGGRVFFPMRLEEVADYFQAVQEELRSQYAVAYKPANFNADGRFRSIQILARSKNLHVRARQGYYAPKQ